MNPEKRTQARQVFHYPAQIDVGDGTPWQRCLIWDVSEEGARITIEAPDAVPDEFVLLLSRDGSVRRRCKIVWRAELQVGVKFVRTSQGTQASGEARSKRRFVFETVEVDS